MKRLSILLVVVVLASTGTACFAATVNSSSFWQVDWYDGDGAVYAQNSSWGRLDVDLNADGEGTYYVNVVAAASGGQSSWAVQNLPVFATGSGSTGLQSVDINLQDLGVSSGTRLSLLDALITVDSSPLDIAPTGSLWSTMMNTLGRRANSDGELGILDTNVGAPAGHKALGAVSQEVTHKDVPGVQEDDRQCLPGSFARSIKWLDNKYNLPGIAPEKTAQDVYNDLLPKMTGTYANRVNEKAKYLKAADPRAVTKVLDLGNFIGSLTDATEVNAADPMAWLFNEMKTEDVELHYDTHIVTLTSVYKQYGLDWVKFRDDTGQGDPNAGDSSIKDGLLYSVGGNYYFARTDGYEGGQIKVLISESVPEPSGLAILLTAVSGVALRLRLGSRRGK
ncbi:MAG: hypothetical protein Q7T82_04780 [Armatimonadota bacterium]|nr:hypothetical protein [Armatimonadota bacterium]